MKSFGLFFFRKHLARLLCLAIAPSLLLSFLSFSALAMDEAPPSLKISRITPAENCAPDARQIVLEFNQPVVPLGQMNRDTQDISVEINPKINCNWR